MATKQTKAQRIAEQIATLLEDASTFTLYGGYAVVRGRTVRFQGGTPELEKRNDKGQMAHARYVYADGSRLTYRRKPDNAYSLEAHT